jgi:polysaccharide export outer membrane protein
MVGAAALFWAAAALGQGNYTIQPGDQLSIEVLEDPNLNRTVLVAPDGRVSFPLAGNVQAGGRTIPQVEAALRSALSDDFANPPNVFVALVGIPQAPGTLETGDLITVYLLGEVNQPGPVQVEPGTTVLQLLAQSGGFTPFAATKRIQLRRTDAATGAQSLVEIDYRSISRGARILAEPTMREGDVVLVPERRLFE